MNEDIDEILANILAKEPLTDEESNIFKLGVTFLQKMKKQKNLFKH